MLEIRIIYEQSTTQKPPTKKTTMVEEMITTVVVVEVEEADVDLVVEVEVVDDHIVLIAGKMIMTMQIVL
jgi:hypothetical protein